MALCVTIKSSSWEMLLATVSVLFNIMCKRMSYGELNQVSSVKQ